MPSPSTVSGERHCVYWSSSVRSSNNTYYAWRDISILSGWILIKLGINIHHACGHCAKGFQGHWIKGQGHATMTVKILWTR